MNPDVEREFVHMREIADLRHAHLLEIRIADQRALTLSESYLKERLERYNEAQARSVEERGHFVSNEAFTPFREQMLKEIRDLREEGFGNRGKNAGTQASRGELITIIGAAATILGIVVVLANVLA